MVVPDSGYVIRSEQDILGSWSSSDQSNTVNVSCISIERPMYTFIIIVFGENIVPDDVLFSTAPVLSIIG